MKKLSCVFAILIVMMALVLTGCGDTPGGNSGSGSTGGNTGGNTGSGGSSGGGSSSTGGNGTNSAVFSGAYSENYSNCTLSLTLNNNGEWTYSINGTFYGRPANFIYAKGTYTGNTTQNGNITLVITHITPINGSTISNATSITNTSFPLNQLTQSETMILTISNNQLSSSSPDFLPITLTRQ